MAATGKEAVTLEQLKSYADLAGGGGFDIDKVYPVGSVYLSMASTDPGTLFGGTWSKLEGRFLLTSDGSRSAGDTGGSNDAAVVSHTHTASTNNAGSHNHTISGGSHNHTASTNNTGSHTHDPYSGDRFMTMYDTTQPACAATTSEVTPYYYAKYTDKTSSAGAHTHSVTVNTSNSHSHTIASNGTHSHTVTVSSAGSSGTNANMPAYLVVNAWQRTA